MNDSPILLSDPARPRDKGNESHRLLAVGSGVALAVQFEQRNGVAGFQTVVFGLPNGRTARPVPIVISADQIVLGHGWEMRTSGLWAEQICERGFDHWSYGLEAFALAIEDPEELMRRAVGHRLPLGWELDFSATATAEPATATATAGSNTQPCSDVHSFRQAGTVEGLIMTDDGQRPFSGTGQRSYWNGDRPGHSNVSRLTNSDRSRPGSVILPTLFGPWTVEVGHRPRPAAGVDEAR